MAKQPQLIKAASFVQRAREQRIARQRAQVDRQLAETLERDRAEEAEREAKGDLRLAVRPRIDAWQANKKVLQHASPAMPTSAQHEFVQPGLLST